MFCVMIKGLNEKRQDCKIETYTCICIQAVCLQPSPFVSIHSSHSVCSSKCSECIYLRTSSEGLSVLVDIFRANRYAHGGFGKLQEALFIKRGTQKLNCPWAMGTNHRSTAPESINVSFGLLRKRKYKHVH